MQVRSVRHQHLLRLAAADGRPRGEQHGRGPGGCPLLLARRRRWGKHYERKVDIIYIYASIHLLYWNNHIYLFSGALSKVPGSGWPWDCLRSSRYPWNIQLQGRHSSGVWQCCSCTNWSSELWRFWQISFPMLRNTIELFQYPFIIVQCPKLCYFSNYYLKVVKK